MLKKSIALTIVCGALLVPAAMAGKPDRARVPLGSANLPAGLACPEPLAPNGVRIELIGGNQAETSFDNGRFTFTGRHVDHITNVANGTSVVLDLQGRYAEVPRDDGSTVGQATGETGIVFFPGDEGPGDTGTGRFYVFTGTVRLVYDEWFAVVGFESTGTMKDVCAMIA